jgi:Flp pilus assembly protein TadG
MHWHLVFAQFCRLLWSREEGTSAVEFAIAAPIFILIVVGILVYGIYFGVALSITQVAAESARASIAGIDNTERQQLALDRASYMIEANGFLEEDRATIVAAPDPDQAKTFVVAVSYDASNLPIFAFSGLIPTPSPTITRTSTIQRGGF